MENGCKTLYVKGRGRILFRTRLFEQGGYIYKDDITDEFIVIMKTYDISLLQEVYVKLCEEFDSIDVCIKSGKKKYRLVFIKNMNRICELR